MKKSLLLFLFNLIFATFTHAQKDVVFYDQNYGLGLCADGNSIWEATISCLIKKNIQTNAFEYISNDNVALPARTIRGVAKAPNGHIWLASDSGVIECVGNIFTRYDMSNSPLPGKIITSIACGKNGVMWCTVYVDSIPAQTQVASFDGSNWTIYNSQNSIVNGSGYPAKIVVDSNNEPWILLNKLYHFDGTTWSYFDDTNSPLMYLSDIAADTLNNIYIAANYNVYKYNGTFTDISPGTILGSIGAIMVDKNQEPWIGVNEINDQYEIAHYNGTAWAFFGAAQGFGHYYIYSMTADENNNIWVGTNGCLQKFDGTTFHQYYTGLPPAAYVTGVVPSYQNKMWVSAGFDTPDEAGGLASFDGTKWEVYTRHNSNLQFDDINVMVTDHAGYMWLAATGGGLYRFDGTVFYLTTFSSLGGISDMNVDANNNLWILSRVITKYDGTNYTTYDSTNMTGLPVFGSLRAFAMDTAGTNIWAGTIINSTTFGLLKFNGTNWTPVNCPYGGMLYCMTVDNENRLWLGTSLGAYCFDGTNWAQYSTTNSGLLNNTVGQIHCDKYGRIYFLGQGDISIYDGFNWSLLHYPRSDWGYSFKSMTHDKNNNLYFCGYPLMWIHNSEGFDLPFEKAAVTGQVFYDYNSNGQKDPGDIGLEGQRIFFPYDSSFYFTNHSGKYKANLDSGSYINQFIPDANWSLTSDSAQYHFLLRDTVECCYDYGTFSINPVAGLEIHLTGSFPRCGSPFLTYINYANTGTIPISGRVVFIPDTSLQYNNFSPMYDAISGDTLIWNFTNLLPGEQAVIYSWFTLPPNSGGVPFNSFVQIDSYDGANYSTEDYDSWKDVARCSSDPNDKIAFPPGQDPEHFILKDDTLEFTIRFENVGNDTAFNILIRDTLSQYIDRSSFRVLASSHPVYTTLKTNGLLEFHFDNIMLPYKSIDDPGSSGFAKYRVIPNTGLPNNTVVNNQAAIYFDYNDPVMTNETWQTLVDSIILFTKEPSVTSGVRVFPNPFSSTTTFEIPQQLGSFSIRIFDLEGREVFRENKNSTFPSARLFKVNGSKWPSGIYFYCIRSMVDGSTLTGKIIKH